MILFGCLANWVPRGVSSDVPDTMLALLMALLATMDTSHMTPACQETYSQVMYDLGCGDRKATMNHYWLLRQNCFDNVPAVDSLAN